MENQQILPRNNAPFVSVFIFSALLVLPGCGLSDLTQAACTTTGGASHCFQEAAVQSGDEANCDNVAPIAEFKNSNPPRDKCVVMIAANEGDPSICDKTKGGIGSYGKEDCVKAIADTTRDPEVCKKLEGNTVSTCMNSAAQKTIDDVEKLKTMKIKNPEDVKEVQQQLEELRKTNEMLTEVMKVKVDAELSVVKNFRI